MCGRDDDPSQHDVAEGRAQVIDEICAEDVERRRLCAEELKSRLVDFWIYLEALKSGGTLTREALNFRSTEEFREKIAGDYISEMIEHEDNDPIGRLCYITPGVPEEE